VVISQSEMLPADHARRPVVVVQSDAFNRSKLATVICIPLTELIFAGIDIVLGR